MSTQKDIQRGDREALERMLAAIKAKQEAYFQLRGKLLTPFDGEFWAVTQAIADLELCTS